MKWKRSRKSKEQSEAGRELKSTNENPASEPREAGLGKPGVEEEGEAEDDNDFLLDTRHSDFLKKHVDIRYASDDMDEMRGGDRQMRAGL